MQYSTRSKSGSTCTSDCCVILTFLSIFAVLCAASFWLFIDVRDPSVVVESIAISLQDESITIPLQDDNATANWDIVLSVQNLNAMSYLEFRDVNVWVNCMSESSSQAVIIPALKLGAGNAIYVRGSVKSSLTHHARSQLVHGSVVDVLLKGVCVHPYQAGQRTVKVVCRDIGVGFLSGVTRERRYCTVEEGYDDYYKRGRRSDRRHAA